MDQQDQSARYRQDEEWLREQILLEQTRYNDIWRVRRFEEILALPPEARSRAVDAERAGRPSPGEETERYETALRDYRIWSVPLTVFCLVYWTFSSRGAFFAAVLGLVMAAGTWWLTTRHLRRGR